VLPTMMLRQDCGQLAFQLYRARKQLKTTEFSGGEPESLSFLKGCFC
jgi:hypothetical protein